MRTFLPLAFWYWLYNQLLFFLGALGFFVIHFLVAFIGFGGMDTLASAILTTLLCIYSLQALRAFSLAQQAAAV
mgnify:CR=1 FL=1